MVWLSTLSGWQHHSTFWYRPHPMQNLKRIFFLHCWSVEELDSLFFSAGFAGYFEWWKSGMLAPFWLACWILCCKQLAMNQVQLTDAHLLQFCRRAEHVYGRVNITPNMHMHGHLHACVEDYCPLHGFLLFSFQALQWYLRQNTK